MIASPALRTFGWLVRETVQRALTTRLFGPLIAAGLVCIAICLSVRIEGPGALRGPDDIELYRADGQPLTEANPNPGELALAFGAFRVPLFRDGPAMVHFLQALFAKWVAGAAGVLLALIWASGFVPEFLQPSEVSVLLTKPISRHALLWGKTVGILLVVALLATFFIGATWIALGARTGFWATGYLWTIPVLCLHFAMFFGVSVWLAVWFRSTVVAAIGTIGFWLVCFLVNSGHNALAAFGGTVRGSAGNSPVLADVLGLAYGALPKPVDLAALLDRTIESGHHFRTTGAFGAVADPAAVQALWVVASALAFTLLALFAAGRRFDALDY